MCFKVFFFPFLDLFLLVCLCPIEYVVEFIIEVFLNGKLLHFRVEEVLAVVGTYSMTL